eukprot:527430-Rhodomonas_salina.2
MSGRESGRGGRQEGEGGGGTGQPASAARPRSPSTTRYLPPLFPSSQKKLTPKPETLKSEPRIARPSSPSPLLLALPSAPRSSGCLLVCSCHSLPASSP